MDCQELYSFLRTKFNRVIEESGIADETVKVSCSGNEMNAVFRGAVGQAESSVPSSFEGTVREASEMNLEDERQRCIFTAVLNAVMGALGYAARTAHCMGKEPEFCAENIRRYVCENYGNPKIALIGMQEDILECLKKNFEVKAPARTSLAEAETKEAVDWADIVLCKGSVLWDGTLCDYLNLDKEVIFYGTALAGCAEWLGVKRMCF